MTPSLLKRRARRLWHRRSNQVEDLGIAAGDQFEENFFGRLGKFRLVRRFVLGWLLLFVLLAGCLVVQIGALRGLYGTIQPVAGGIYSEGIEGSFTTANPLYAVNDVDTSVARLLFASLLTYNSHNQLVGDLADRWSVDATGKIYTIHLRPNLTWQDGSPLTADDVLFTYRTIQNPDARSPLQSSWQGVAVAELNKRTITFTLPNPLVSFPYGLTNGIVPQHVLGSVNVADLRSVNFNTVDPIGAGPFRWGSIGVSGTGQSTETQVSLIPFRQYWAGAPKISTFNIYAFANQGTMLKAYRDSAITAMVGLGSVPDYIAKDSSMHIYNLPLTAGTFVFFKTTNPLLKDARIRQALELGADRGAIIQQLGYPAIPVNEPLLIGQLGYNRKYAEATDSPGRAGALLDADGWRVGADGIRSKKGQALSFTLSALNHSEYARVATHLRDQWKAIGVDAKIQLQESINFQDTLSQHEYDAILYGISIGVDPDVFVYWDSSQANPQSATRLNFSEYKSAVADDALEAGRTRAGNRLRTIKYQTFLKSWQQDAPALGLYQPRLLYISHVPIYGLGESQINTDADRFDNVDNWMTHTGWVAN